MDWKNFYRDELACPEGRTQVREIFDALAAPDVEIETALRRRAVLSFPHTSVRYSGAVTGRVVAALYRAGVSRVIALGVLHGQCTPPPYRELFREYQRLTAVPARGDRLAREIFDTFRGGFAAPPPSSTVFGDVPRFEPEGVAESPLRECAQMLANEFSLDTFLSLMAFHACRLERDPIPVFPVYVGMTRDPDGSFEAAGELARWLRAAAPRGTAVVTTADLVHYGHAYSAAGEMDGMPTDPLHLTRHFRDHVERALALALKERDYERSHQTCSTTLKSDHRHLLPIIAEYLGAGAKHRLLSFTLSDYQDILGVPPPCMVASALAAYFPPESAEEGLRGDREADCDVFASPA
jgi:predicted class III extradiol MEMO1 family dioxygenase